MRDVPSSLLALLLFQLVTLAFPFSITMSSPSSPQRESPPASAGSDSPLARSASRDHAHLCKHQRHALLPLVLELCPASFDVVALRTTESLLTERGEEQATFWRPTRFGEARARDSSENRRRSLVSSFLPYHSIYLLIYAINFATLHHLAPLKHKHHVYHNWTKQPIIFTSSLQLRSGRPG